MLHVGSMINVDEVIYVITDTTDGKYTFIKEDLYDLYMESGMDIPGAPFRTTDMEEGTAIIDDATGEVVGYTDYIIEDACDHCSGCCSK